MYRTEYPRPNFVREQWLSLNGEWSFRFDNEDWRKINVPFAFQSKLSGIGENRLCDIVWYKRTFKVPTEWKGKQVIIQFGAVDYKCMVHINGKQIGQHIGGHTNFSFDITNYLNWREEEILIYVEDPCEDETIPRGKQYWLEKPDGIWYKRTTGIWQSVWIEAVSQVHLEYIRFTPDVDRGNIEVELETALVIQGLKAEIEIYFQDLKVISDVISVNEKYNNRIINLFNKKILRSATHQSGWCWTPETPNLFDVIIRLVRDEIILDEVKTYFGMRKIHKENGMIYLNNRPYYQKLVLDQGYWPDGLMTAPSDECFQKDIKMAKAMGFNGCRKHQKIEDPRFLYWADKLGFLVWEEMPNCTEYSFESVERTVDEWMAAIKRDYNHPSIVVWVPLNESWGIPRVARNKMEQHHSLTMYHLTHSLDSTRLVVSNDGWELTETDICAVHNYNHGSKEEKEKYNYFIESISNKENILVSQPAGRTIYANGFHHKGEPILLTEFGGIAYDRNNNTGWGYTVVTTEEEFLRDYERVIDAVYRSEVIYGFCYTQLTDVEQEINGLLTYNREPKCNLDKIREINEKWRNNIVK